MSKCKHGIEPDFDCALCFSEAAWIRWVWMAIICIGISFWASLFAIFAGRIGL